MNVRTVFAGFVLLCLAAGTAGAQPMGKGARHRGIDQHLFPAALIMRHQQALGLTDAQRERIKAEMQEAQKRFLDLRWELQKERESMAGLLRKDPVDEKKVLEQMDRILDLERKIKRTHMSLLVRIKNLLTPQQKEKLAELRRRFAPKHRRGHRGMGPHMEAPPALATP